MIIINIFFGKGCAATAGCKIAVISNNKDVQSPGNELADKTPGHLDSV